jgi:hypothetical protein
MAHYRTTFTTSTPAERAFDYLSRFSTTVEWDPGVVEAHDLGPGPVAVGSAFHVVSSVAGARVPLRYEIIEMDRPHRVVLRAENWSVTSLDTISVAHQRGPGPDEGGTTTVTYEADLTPRGVTRLFSPLLALAFGCIGDRAAAGLREAVEALADDADRPPAPVDRADEHRQERR